MPNAPKIAADRDQSAFLHHMKQKYASHRRSTSRSLLNLRIQKNLNETEFEEHLRNVSDIIQQGDVVAAPLAEVEPEPKQELPPVAGYVLDIDSNIRYNVSSGLGSHARSHLFILHQNDRPEGAEAEQMMPSRAMISFCYKPKSMLLHQPILLKPLQWKKK